LPADLTELELELRSHLSTIVAQIIENHESLLCRVRDNQPDEIDTSMYAGAPGVLFSLHKYLALLLENKKGPFFSENTL
jgi:hypothetical protein